MSEPKCEVRIFPIGGGFDVFRVCESKIETLKEQPKAEDKGSNLGFIWASIVCSNYADGFDYDWETGKYECRGEWRPIMWRR